MKQTIRAFALGLFTASLIILVVLFATNGGKNTTSNLSTNEMITSLKNDGYRVMTESEYISLSVQYDEARTEENEKKQAEHEEKRQEIEGETKDKKDDKAKSQDKDKDKEKSKDKEKEDVRTVTIKVESGMPPSKISDRLESEGVIDDARKFDEYLEKNDYVKYIQLGEHKVETNMTQEEVAKALTK